MFMITLNKKNIKRIAVGCVCASALCIGWFSTSSLRESSTQVNSNNSIKISSTQDIQTFFTGYGFTADPVDISADKVEIPKNWDDSFAAFNTLVAQSGFDLTDYEGKTVEKWLARIPALSLGENTVYGVLLVYKETVIGSYLLEKPSGKVTGLADALQESADNAAAQAAMQELETQSALGTQGADGDINIQILPEQEASTDAIDTPSESVFPTE